MGRFDYTEIKFLIFSTLYWFFFSSELQAEIEKLKHTQVGIKDEQQLAILDEIAALREKCDAKEKEMEEMKQYVTCSRLCVSFVLQNVLLVQSNLPIQSPVLKGHLFLVLS